MVEPHRMTDNLGGETVALVTGFCIIHLPCLVKKLIQPQGI